MPTLQTKCAKCGHVLIDVALDKVYECTCELVARRFRAMPADVRPVIPMKKHFDHQLMDPKLHMERRSVFMICYWADVRAFIKITMLRHYKMYLRVVSDLELRNAYVGNMSKSARSADYAGEIINSIEDMVDEPHLVVLRLNELTNKNKAVAGALEEALIYRMHREKPTWVVSDPDRPFQKGSHAYSEQVAELLGTAFLRMVIPRIAPRVSIDVDSLLSMENIDPVQSGREESWPSPSPAPVTSSSPVTSILGDDPVPTRSSRPMKDPKQTRVRSTRKPDDDDGLPDATPDALSIYGSGINNGRRGRGNN